ncbi:MAG: HAD-IIB family hydrolase [Verrucomicrobia bacterium]|nr:HAD-IIB family hydrolase [Pseudomonadota bacterium]NBS06345.1 HAD-IIB family hydrolase [Verrucomicrobiota bacterium]NBS78892.1 HAD-IIB family hydrolase [bacterium]NBS50196.1 HAD-IIB family hydrolase [Verrucomicrobiota bacterium]NBT23356.1 HAD-IIB family hydrolase [bacterium]
MKAQLVCTDFDGTLAGENPEEPLAPRFFQWLSGSRKSGEISWVVATGRSWESLREALVVHQAPVMPDWIVTVEREIHQVKEGQAHSLEAWNKVCAETHQALFGRHGALLERIEREVGSTDEVTVIPDAGAIGLIAGSKESIDRTDALVNEIIREHPEISTVRNGPYFRFAHVDYHKGSCLAEIQKLLDLPPSSTFIAGDNLNDLPMLRRKFGHFLACPSNSVPEVLGQVRKEGGYLASGTAGDGIAEALFHWFPLPA